MTAETTIRSVLGEGAMSDGSTTANAKVLPEGFLFGVATAAFQVEGGINGPGEPANNWVSWERAGRVEPSGSAISFWDRYEELLDRAAAMGCNVFRIGVEWARVEPEHGQIDTHALDRYEAIVDACIERGMEPLVTIHHFTHPYWLGEDFWLSAESPDIFRSWAELVVDRLGGKCHKWITINEINIVAFASYVMGIYPPGRRTAMGDFHSATAHLLAAHVKAYEAVHARVPDAMVTTNNSLTSVYENDRLYIDILLARESGVDRADLGEWISERRRSWYAAIDPPSGVEWVLRRLSATSAPVARKPLVPTGKGSASGGRPSGRFEPAIEAIYSSPHVTSLDALGVDYYDPVGANHIRMPGRHTAGGRSMSTGSELWDDVVDPIGLTTYIRANIDQSAAAASRRERPIPLWVVENGLSNRVRRGRSFDRSDGWDRPRYIRENVAAVVDAIDSGLPVSAYLHWTLADNYEWGSYEPRFGIHGVDRERHTKILDTDAMGHDAAGAYRRVIKGLMDGDRSVLFTR